jgi:hypothetical protein
LDTPSIINDAAYLAELATANAAAAAAAAAAAVSATAEERVDEEAVGGAVAVPILAVAPASLPVRVPSAQEGGGARPRGMSTRAPSSAEVLGQAADDSGPLSASPGAGPELAQTVRAQPTTRHSLAHALTVKCTQT